MDGACVDNPSHGRWLHAHDKISKQSGNTCGTLLSHSANLQSLGVTASLLAPPVNPSALGITQKPSKIIPKSKYISIRKCAAGIQYCKDVTILTFVRVIAQS